MPTGFEGTILEHTSIGEIISIAIGVGLFFGAVLFTIISKFLKMKTGKEHKKLESKLIDEDTCDRRHSATEKSFCLKLDAVEVKMGATKELIKIELGHMKEKVDTLFGKVDDVHDFMNKVNGAVNGKAGGDLITKLNELGEKIDKKIKIE